MDIKHFNNVQISYSADGTGKKGVISQQLTFNVPSAEYGTTQGLFPYGAEVIVSCSLSLPKFYVHSRKPNGVNVSLVCYDRTMFTANKLTISEDSFYTLLSSEPSDWATSYKKYYTRSESGYSSVTGGSAPEFVSGKYYSLGYISINSVIDNIKTVCGFSSINTGDIIGSVITKLQKDNVLNKSAKDVLSGLSEASGGCFFAQENDSLAFMPFACGSISAEFSVKKYKKVCYGLSVSCDTIVLQNGNKVYSSGGSSCAFGTMFIDTVYASSDLLGGLMNTLYGKTYTAWKCDNSLVDHYPAPGAGVIFGDNDDVLVCNFCKIKITSSGFFASMGRNDVSESEYISEYSRALSERVKIGEVNGSTKVTRDGVKLVYINENEGRSEEYGFKTSSGGVTEYDGVMIDKTMPTEISDKSTDSSGVTEQRIKYGDKTYLLTYKNENGIKKDIEMVEVTA